MEAPGSSLRLLAYLVEESFVAEGVAAAGAGVLSVFESDFESDLESDFVSDLVSELPSDFVAPSPPAFGAGLVPDPFA